MDHVAAGEHEDTLVAEGGQAGAEVQVVVPGLAGVDAELDHRDAGREEHVGQHRPGAVVDPQESRSRPTHGVDHLGHPLGQLGEPGAGYSVAKSASEAVEVVDRRRLRPARSPQWR